MDIPKDFNDRIALFMIICFIVLVITIQKSNSKFLNGRYMLQKTICTAKNQ